MLAQGALSVMLDPCSLKTAARSKRSTGVLYRGNGVGVAVRRADNFRNCDATEAFAVAATSHCEVAIVGGNGQQELPDV